MGTTHTPPSRARTPRSPTRSKPAFRLRRLRTLSSRFASHTESPALCVAAAVSSHTRHPVSSRFPCVLLCARGVSNDARTMEASKELFKTLEAAVADDGSKLVSMFKGVALFKIDGEEYLLDLQYGGGDGSLKPDVTLTMSDDIFVKLATGKIAPQVAFIQGKLKIQGNIALSMKLTPVLKAAQPKAKL